jgi:hypothetical protein
MLDFLSNFGRFFTGDLTPAEMKSLSSAFFKVGWRIGLALFVMFSLGMFSSIGMNGFALAGEMSKQIDAATAPIVIEQASQRKVLERISGQLRESAVRDASSQMRLLAAKRCLEKIPSERQRLSGEIDKMQDEYYSLKGYLYNTPACSDL